MTARRCRILLRLGVLMLVWLPFHSSSAAAEDRSPCGRMVLDDCFAAAPPAPSVAIEGWRAIGGRWRSEDGVVRGEGDGGSMLVCDRPLPADFEFAADVLLTEGIQWSGLIACVREPREGADNFFGYEAGVDPGRKIVRLGVHRNNYELIRDQPWPLRTGSWSDLRIRRTGSRIEVLVDGAVAIVHDDGPRALAAGSPGLRVWRGALACRDLRVVTDGVERPLAAEPSQNALDAARLGTSAAWTPAAEGAAEFAHEDGGLFGPGKAQRLAVRNQGGRAEIASAGSRSEGIAWVAGRAYRGAVWVRAEEATTLIVSARSAGCADLDRATLSVPAGDWRRLPYRLQPGSGDERGRLVLGLDRPGEVRVARVALEPEEWAWPNSLALKRLPPILYLARPMLTGPPAVGCDIWAARPTEPGCAIRAWDPAKPDAPPRTVFEDPAGSIYDMNLSLDAGTVYFSYAPAGEKHWHLWRIGADGSGLRQITHGPYYDVSPCELPEGDLVFVSTRRFGHTVCQPGPASNLYRIAPAGGEPRCLSMNTLADTTPQLLPDGRVLFMRWEYVDRDLTFRQSLWTQNPDGTGYQLFFGNTIRDPGTFWQARPVPGSDRVLATFAPHHGYPHGAIGWVSPRHGPEAPRGVGFDWLTPEFPTIGDRSIVWSYRDPFPLDEETFLAAYGGGIDRFRIVLCDGRDRRRTLVEEPRWHCFFPIALRPAPRPPVVAGRAPQPAAGEPDLPEEHASGDQPVSVCFLVDVYRGLEPAIERGRVKSIRIMEQVRKTEDIPVAPHTVDFGPRAYDQSPTMSYGTYYAKRCWGTVPVEADGSALFEAPALREIYFQACDGQGRELQRMTSAVQLMPGETAGCVGCHEHRLTAPPLLERSPLALRRRPSVPRKPDWARDGIIDFVGTVQPVLDRHCTECHSGGDPAGGYDLSGDKTRLFSMAYDNLLGRSRSYRQHNMATGEMLSEEAAKGKPLIHFYWLLKTPTAVNQPLWTGSHASRLTEILESDHAGRPIPLEDRQRVYLWIDADVPYYGTFATSRPRCTGKRDLLGDPASGEPEAWYARDFQPLYARRCEACHGELPAEKLVTCWDGRTAWINFTHPQWSPALTAHLPKSAGGRGIDRAADGTPIPQFAGTDDPDYQAMLRALEEGRRRAQAAPRPDMPGYTGRVKEP